YSPATRQLHSFPTRRSSDLVDRRVRSAQTPPSKYESPLKARESDGHFRQTVHQHAIRSRLAFARSRCSLQRDTEAACACSGRERSEEHTSELQSLRHLVCRL